MSSIIPQNILKENSKLKKLSNLSNLFKPKLNDTYISDIIKSKIIKKEQAKKIFLKTTLLNNIANKINITDKINK